MGQLGVGLVLQVEFLLSTSIMCLDCRGSDVMAVTMSVWGIWQALECSSCLEEAAHWVGMATRDFEDVVCTMRRRYAALPFLERGEYVNPMDEVGDGGRKVRRWDE